MRNILYQIIFPIIMFNFLAHILSVGALAPSENVFETPAFPTKAE